MNEKPILFSGPMVGAILEGRKTQTRRVVKPQPLRGHWIAAIRRTLGTNRGEPEWHDLFSSAKTHNTIRCPYGKPGDRLWVRETHYRYGRWIKNGFTEAGKQRWRFSSQSPEVCYADDPPLRVRKTRGRTRGWHKRPSIFMQKFASRVTLEITDIRVERLRDMTLEDAQCEGVEIEQVEQSTGKQWHAKTLHHFIAAWDALNTKRGYPWKSNPWVWVISFKQI